MTTDNTEKKLEIWTDGASKGNPGIGGWGAYLVWGAHTKEIFGGAPNVTNNQMELTAVIEALKLIRRPCPVIIHTDSSYVKDGITKWIHGWKKKNWMTASKTPVKNRELWQELDRLCGQFAKVATASADARDEFLNFFLPGPLHFSLKSV